MSDEIAKLNASYYPGFRPLRRQKGGFWSKVYCEQVPHLKPLHDAQHPNPNPYCSAEMRERLNAQRAMEAQVGKGFMDYAHQRGSIGWGDVPSLIRRTRCDHCDKPVSDIEIHYMKWNHWYKFFIRCHGAQEIYEMTEAEYIYVIRNHAKAIAFLDAQKQEARDWMTRQIFSMPEFPLLENKPQPILT